MGLVEFIEGPAFWFALAVFVAGALWRFVGIIRIGHKPDLAPPKGSAGWGWIRGNLRHFFPRGLFAERTWMHVLGGYAFHLGLFAVMFFAAPHVDFIRERLIGVGWPALPRWGFIIAAEIAFAGLIVLWVRRFSDPVMRLISDWDDHVGSWLTFLVMLTGCLALERAHVSLRALHMGLVELWLIYFPFSRLMHAFTFMLSRGATGASYGRKGMTL
ncbi:MAG: nitrate reductase [Alphaproteobacteria bacterium]|nr:MAG: nitrate reductase [Alphaproteobacteria bacterium]